MNRADKKEQTAIVRVAMIYRLYSEANMHFASAMDEADTTVSSYPLYYHLFLWIEAKSEAAELLEGL